MLPLIKFVILIFISFNSIDRCENISVTDLLNLSYSISERLLYRTGSGSIIISDIETYLEKLKEVLRMVEENSLDGELVYAALKKRCGPAHANMTYVDRTLMEHYCWTVDDAFRVEQLLDETLTLWSQIEELGDSKWNVTGLVTEPPWVKLFKPDPVYSDT